MKKALICFGVIFAFCVMMLSGANAEDTSKENTSSNRPGEKELYDQMRAAEKSKDKVVARQLRTQLMALHNANTLKMKKDKKGRR